MTLHSFTRAFYERFAANFVDIYETEGPKAAAVWSLKEIPQDKRKEARPYITDEFLSRGYTFSEDAMREEREAAQ